ncbi:hypothetical protein [Cytophaga aurantiaca]|uniref:hypothetical protein n=1 Tax=Cytophaga aurantiaca TaxID=29530 RepID=UPI000371567A|nr:hypothetical protein [Cytophaga aurantiaca]
MKKKIAIIGAGTYGSYLANALTEKFSDVEVHLFEVGDQNTKSEAEIGFVSKLKKGLYRATSDGRFFGLGGTSAKWGGQLLFFSNKDFSNPNGMKTVIESNITYRSKVLSRFFKQPPILTENDFGSGMFRKQGVWLKFSQRNLFNHFNLSKNKQVIIHSNVRVVKLNKVEGKIHSIAIQESHNESTIFEADVFYLTSGAFESLRLMHVSELIDMAEVSKGFSDHVSLRAFEIETTQTKIGSQDFQFRFENGSMITSRLIGEMDNVSYYIHPVFNEKFIFFQFLKRLIFKGDFSSKVLFSAASQAFAIFPFVYSYFFLKKLYVYKSWFLNIDIELSKSENSVVLSNEQDIYKQNGVELEYSISEDSLYKLKKIKESIAKILKENKIDFIELEDNDASSLKLEDTYHPYRLFSSDENKDITELYNPYVNLFVFNTGLLQRSGGINPTAALFCFIEHHIETTYPI